MGSGGLWLMAVGLWSLAESQRAPDVCGKPLRSLRELP